MINHAGRLDPLLREIRRQLAETDDEMTVRDLQQVHTEIEGRTATPDEIMDAMAAA